MNGTLKLGATAALLAVLGSQSGCGTVVNLWLGVDERDPAARPPMDTQAFGGILNDFHGVDEALRGEEGLWMSLLGFPFFAFIDLPLSLAGDLLTLPYTSLYVVVRAERKASPP